MLKHNNNNKPKIEKTVARGEIVSAPKSETVMIRVDVTTRDQINALKTTQNYKAAKDVVQAAVNELISNLSPDDQKRFDSYLEITKK